MTALRGQELEGLILELHRRSSFLATSNRTVGEWPGRFDDPIPGNSALDRLAHGAHPLVIEGSR